MSKISRIAVFFGLCLILAAGVVSGSESAAAVTMDDLVDVQKYNRSIHVLAMLLVGFGFLMVFVKHYGRSAVTATYMLVAASVPLYFLMDSQGILGGPHSIIDKLILSEFSAASLLICAGAVLGRLKMIQYMVLAVLFIPLYALNEWLVIEGGLGIVSSFVDTGGSIVIHAFGAFFGLGVATTMTTREEHKIPIETDYTSDRFSLLGSMLLWFFWPSFCSALVAPADVPMTAANVVLALCGSTLATWFASSAARKKVSIADIANAALAGGVAIGSTCDKVGPGLAFLIGILAGALSTYGFAVIQPRLEKMLGIQKTDTCGVFNLHGLPGLLGGLTAMVAVSGMNLGSQALGIAITLGIAGSAGLVSGKILAILGRRTQAYTDEEEFII